MTKNQIYPRRSNGGSALISVKIVISKVSICNKKLFWGTTKRYKAVFVSKPVLITVVLNLNRSRIENNQRELPNYSYSFVA